MTPFTHLEAAFIGAVIFVFGLMIGSFLNVVIYRLPADESIVWPGSHCPKCETPLTAWENIPLLSWLALRGRCRTCKLPISWRYPATELATGALFWAVYQAHGLSWQTGFLLVMIALMVVTFWIDIDHMLILDVITLPGAALGLLYSWLITGQFWFSLAALLYGVAVLLLINGLTQLVIGREGIGGGDLTLIAMLGAWLGLQQTLLALGLAMIAGAAMGLVLLFWGWARERCWQPFAIAGAGALAAYAGATALMGSAAGLPLGEAFWGPGLGAMTRASIAGLAGLLGASGAWLYMRAARDEGYLEMPFGPALVLGALGALFWGVPLIDWYVRSMGAL
jgi:leader peptidase (prepilin peptidase)/N-methyltransferase